MSRQRVFLVLRVLALVFLLARVGDQFDRSPPTTDPDPDGYISYIEHIESTGSLMPSSRRLPGYPLFLMIASAVTGKGYHQAYYVVQKHLLLLFLALCFLFLWKNFGYLSALVFGGILALPNFFVFQSTIMLSDAVYAMLIVPFLIWSLRKIYNDRVIFNAKDFAVLFLAVIGLQLIRSTTGVLLGILYAIVFLGLIRVRQRGRGLLALRKTLLAFSILSVSYLGIHYSLGEGSAKFNSLAFKARIAWVLPPATDHPSERAVEEYREKWNREHPGHRLERSFYALWGDAPLDDVNEVGLARLKSHPAQFSQSIFQSAIWNYHKLLRTLSPYRTNIESLYFYPPEDGSNRSRVFRSIGLDIESGVGVALVTSLGVLLILFFGIKRVLTWDSSVAMALVWSAMAYFFFLCTAAGPEARYMLPFIVIGYGAMAIGFAVLLRSLVTVLARFIP